MALEDSSKKQNQPDNKENQEIFQLKQKYCVENGVIQYSKIDNQKAEGLDSNDSAGFAQNMKKVGSKIQKMIIGKIPDFSELSLDSKEARQTREELAKIFNCKPEEVALGLLECTKPAGEIKVIFIQNQEQRVTLARTTQDPHLMQILLKDENVGVALALAENKYLTPEMKARISKYIEALDMKDHYQLINYLRRWTDSQINKELLFKIFGHISNLDGLNVSFETVGFNNSVFTSDFLQELYTSTTPSEKPESKRTFYTFFALHPNTPDDIYDLAENNYSELNNNFSFPLNVKRVKAKHLQKTWEAKIKHFNKKENLNLDQFFNSRENVPGILHFFDYPNLSSETISEIWDYVYKKFLIKAETEEITRSSFDFFIGFLKPVASHSNTPDDILQKLVDLDELYTTDTNLSLRTALILNQNTNNLVVKNDELGPENKKNLYTFEEQKQKYVSEILNEIFSELTGSFSTEELSDNKSRKEFIQQIQSNFDTATLIPLKSIPKLLNNLSAEELAKNPRLVLLGASSESENYSVTYGYIGDDGKGIMSTTNRADPHLKYQELGKQVVEGELDERKILAMLNEHLRLLNIGIKIKDTPGLEDKILENLERISFGNYEMYKMLAKNPDINEEIFNKLAEIAKQSESKNQDYFPPDFSFDINLALAENKKITKVKQTAISNFFDRIYLLYCFNASKFNKTKANTEAEQIAVTIAVSPFATTEILSLLVKNFSTYNTEVHNNFYPILLTAIFAHPNSEIKYKKSDGEGGISFLGNATRQRQGLSINPTFNIDQIRSYLNNLEVDLPTLIEILTENNKDGLLQNCPSNEKASITVLILKRIAGVLTTTKSTKLSDYFPSSESLNEYKKAYFEAFWSEAKNTPNKVVEMILAAPTLANNYVYKRYLEFFKWLDLPENKALKSYFGEKLEVEYKNEIMPIEYLIPTVFEFIQKVVLNRPNKDDEKMMLLVEQEEKLPDTLSHLLHYNNPNSLLGLVVELKKYIKDNNSIFRDILSKKPGKVSIPGYNKTIALAQVIEAASNLDFILNDEKLEIVLSPNLIPETFIKYLIPEKNFNFTWIGDVNSLSLTLDIYNNSKPEDIAIQIQALKDYLEKVLIELKKQLKPIFENETNLEEAEEEKNFDEIAAAFLEGKERQEKLLQEIEQEVYKMNEYQEKLHKIEEEKSELEGRLETEEITSNFAHEEDAENAKNRIKKIKQELEKIEKQQDNLKQKIGDFYNSAEKEFELKLNRDPLIDKVFDNAKKIAEDLPKFSNEEAEYLEKIKSILSPVRINYDQVQSSGEIILNQEFIVALNKEIQENIDKYKKELIKLYSQKLEAYRKTWLPEYEFQLQNLKTQYIAEIASKADDKEKLVSEYNRQKIILKKSFESQDEQDLAQRRKEFDAEMTKFKEQQEVQKQARIDAVIQKQIDEAKQREAEVLKASEAQSDQGMEQLEKINIEEIPLEHSEKKLAIFHLIEDLFSFHKKNKLSQIHNLNANENFLPTAISKELDAILAYRKELKTNWNNLKKLYGGSSLSLNEQDSLEAKLLNPDLKFPKGLIYGDANGTQSGAQDYLTELKKRYENLALNIEIQKPEDAEDLKKVLNLEIFKLNLFLELFS